MKETIFKLIQKPAVHYIVFMALTILSSLLWRPKGSEGLWNRAGMLFIGFIAVNSLFICFTDNTWHYFFYALGFSILYLLSIAVLIPLLKSMLKLEGQDESSMVFIFIIYHPVFLLLMAFLKWAYVALHK